MKTQNSQNEGEKREKAGKEGRERHDRKALWCRLSACGPGAYFRVRTVSPRAIPGGTSARPMITAPIVDSNLVRLRGNVRPEANAANDRGRVPDTLPMEHMFLQLQRPAAQEQALKQLIDQLHDPASPKFHQWLYAEPVRRPVRSGRIGYSAGHRLAPEAWIPASMWPIRAA